MLKRRTGETTALALATLLTLIVVTPTSSYEPRPIEHPDHYAAVILPEPTTSPRLDPYRDFPLPVASLTTQPPVAQPTAKTVAVATPKPKPPAAKAVGKSMKGTATWYCLPGVSVCPKVMPNGGLGAAASHPLQDAIGPNWRGTWVTVTYRPTGLSVRVKLVDSCWCPVTNRIIDLFAEPMELINPAYRSNGGGGVTVRW